MELERIRPVEVVVVVDVVRVVVMMMWMGLVQIVGVVDGRRSMSAPLSRLKISTGTLGLVDPPVAFPTVLAFVVVAGVVPTTPR